MKRNQLLSITASLVLLVAFRCLFTSTVIIPKDEGDDVRANYPIHTEQGDVVTDEIRTRLFAVKRAAAARRDRLKKKKGSVSIFREKMTQSKADFEQMGLFIGARRSGHWEKLRDMKVHAASYKMYKPSALLGQRIVYYLHIHKTGGTSLCRTAYLNGMRANMKRNCNVQNNQKCCGEQDTMQAQVDYAKRTGFRFVASENEMYDAMNVNHYFYVISLRDSHARYVSHWNHAQGSNHAKERKQMTTFREWWIHQPDNFQFRMLCGPTCHNAVKYQITKDQFDYTVERLKKFEGFVFLETFEDSVQKLSTQLGWPTNLTKTENVRKYAKKPSNDDDWDENMSILDDALYELALQLDKGLVSPTLSDVTKNSLSAYFMEGPKQNCTNICCGKCSQYR